MGVEREEGVGKGDVEEEGVGEDVEGLGLAVRDGVFGCVSALGLVTSVGRDDRRGIGGPRGYVCCGRLRGGAQCRGHVRQRHRPLVVVLGEGDIQNS